MSWDQDKFLQSVMVLVQKHFDGVQKDFNAKIHDRDAISRWKKGCVIIPFPVAVERERDGEALKIKYQ